MGEKAIIVSGLSKSYRLGVIGRQTLQDEMTYWWHKMRGRNPSDHMGRIREMKKRSSIGDQSDQLDPDNPNLFWALRDVSFEMEAGEVLGIIGRNGAGKSTLLKILTRITEPTGGEAMLNGRVASLLEVGTGFHPELTGRENIFLNGSILGMSRAETEKKCQAIVDFAEIGEFIDTPVKRYSSGMHVRLAFAVAAHLEPEILLVDEVLAVGDVEFQKKCLGKMKNVAGQGRTVLFVSHNMGAIRNLCRRVLLIDKGRLVEDGPADHIIARYLDRNLLEGMEARAAEIEERMEGVILKDKPFLRFERIALVDSLGQPRKVFHSDEEVGVQVTFRCHQTVKDLRLVVSIVDEDTNVLLATQNADDAEVTAAWPRYNPGVYRAGFRIPANTFGGRNFFISAELCYPKTEHLVVNKILEFEVKFKGYENVQYGSYEATFFRPRFKWTLQEEQKGS